MSVVVPAGTTALPVLLAALPAVAEVIVVVGRDDDTTAPAAPRAARVIRQTRTGIGNALACGVAASTGDVVVTLPGDGACDPAELPRYIRALRDGADVAQGTRFRGAGRDLSGGRMSRTGARIVLWLMAVLFGCRRSDPGFGFRAFWRDVAGSVGLPPVAGVEPQRGDGAEIEPLLTVRAALNGLVVTEVPGVAYPRTGPVARAGLLEAARALAGEYVARRRAAPVGTPDSIVVMTRRDGAAERLRRTGTDTGSITPGAGARAAMTGRVGLDPAWSGSRAEPVDGPGLGRRSTDNGVERRQGARRLSGGAGEPRPPAGRTPGAGEPRVPAGRTLGDATTVRRRWRDNRGHEVGAERRRVQSRPNLRVINGEGAGDGSSRTAGLRAVPPADLDR
ncbi:glycosyltransferase family 2 protein [Actinoplanes siamensis]|uniref:Glycosyltransferase 2-like domain-containing protein n=1 Tax=Actinoplanes siamensis TaxID=1223317 RepID=A0A919THN2_9ACTN|nr:glycosyltransferase family 2 protein [Actinoplanes siamensis]GIF03622.1 hypothetical protein Asi03nite_11600 [Actinoplanes siamensis]